MPDILLSLGGIVFYAPVPDMDTPGYEVFSQDSNYSWIPAQRLSRDPAMQFTGPGEDVISIEGRLYPKHFGGLSTITLIREAGRMGKPFQLIRYYPLDEEGSYGFGGRILGSFVIRRVRSVDQKIGPDGVPHRLDFQLELVAYGEDRDLAAIQTAPPATGQPFTEST